MSITQVTYPVSLHINREFREIYPDKAEEMRAKFVKSVLDAQIKLDALLDDNFSIVLSQAFQDSHGEYMLIVLHKHSSYSVRVGNDMSFESQISVYQREKMKNGL